MYTKKVDVYSFGVIVWELLTRSQFFNEIPFHHQLETAVVSGQVRGHYLDTIRHCSHFPCSRHLFSLFFLFSSIYVCLAI